MLYIVWWMDGWMYVCMYVCMNKINLLYDLLKKSVNVGKVFSKKSLYKFHTEIHSCK